MNWFKKKKDDSNDDYEAELLIDTKDVPLSTLYRWYLFDTAVDDPNKYATQIGLTSISEEGIQKEKDDSTKRLHRVLPLKEFVSTMSAITAEVFSEAIIDVASEIGLVKKDEDLDARKDAMKDICISISMSTLIPALSTALELGILVNPGAFTTVEDIIHGD